MREVNLRPRAVRDLRRIGRGPEQERVAVALRELTEDTSNLDIKALTGATPWLRMRVGDYRVLDLATDEGYEIERIVHRRELDRAVGTLSTAG